MKLIKKNKNTGGGLYEKIILIQIAIILISLTCWGFNLKRLIGCDFDKPYKAEVIYALGVFTPTCLVTAWLDLDVPKEGVEAANN